jgi:hypothetical protein
MPRINIAKITRHGRRKNGTRKNMAKLIIRETIYLPSPSLRRRYVAQVTPHALVRHTDLAIIISPIIALCKCTKV